MSDRAHLFNFILRPIEEVCPWGGPGSENLHWFGLTDGWYWMDVGGVELMRYSQRLIDATPDWKWERPYVDYQVSRLYEDLLDILPSIIDPVPSDILDVVRTQERETEWIQLYEQWAERYLWNCPARKEQTASQEAEMVHALNLSERLIDWWQHRRKLPRGHVTGDPDLAMWREGDQVTIRWKDDCGTYEETGIPWVDLSDGEVSLPFDRFLTEVQSFHDRLMGEMGARVEIARTDWPLPNVAIDVPELVASHADRVQSLSRALAKAEGERTNWSEVREAISEVRRLAAEPDATPRRFAWQDEERPQPQFMNTDRPRLVINPHHPLQDDADPS